MSGSDYTTTPNLGLFKPTVNADDAQWGNHLNANADVLDTALRGGGPFLPISGGTIAGPVTFAAPIGTPVLFGTGTLATGPNQFQVAFNYDPSTGPSYTRQSVFNTTLSYATATNNIWENCSSRVFLNGPGEAMGEVNALHGFVQVNAGAHFHYGEAVESSCVNNGIMDTYSGYLSLVGNGVTGTANVLSGMTIYMTNDNPAPAAIGVWAGINFLGRSGAGSQPTYYLAIRNEDPNAGIATVGGIVVGELGNAMPGRLNIVGTDTSSSTLPFIYNTSAGNVFYFSNDGVVHFPMAGVTINSPAAGSALTIVGHDNNPGTFPIAVHNQSGTVCFAVNNSGFVEIGGGAAFFGAPGVPTKPTITGSRGGNAALAGLLTTLANYGLLNDGTGA